MFNKKMTRYHLLDSHQEKYKHTFCDPPKLESICFLFLYIIASISKRNKKEKEEKKKKKGNINSQNVLHT